jgi:flagellar hook-length control protein FliK
VANVNPSIVSDQAEPGTPAAQRPAPPSQALRAVPAPAPAAIAPPVVLRPVDAAPISEVTAPAARVMPPPVHDQIVSAVVPLHGRGDGRHEVTLELRPDDLGTIRVEVSVEHQTVHLTLHAAEAATSRILTAALPELRSALVGAGLTAGHVGVGPDGGGGPGPRGPSTEADGRTGRGARRAEEHDEEGPRPARTIRPAAAGRLDLFL